MQINSSLCVGLNQNMVLPIEYEEASNKGTGIKYMHLTMGFKPGKEAASTLGDKEQ